MAVHLARAAAKEGRRRVAVVPFRDSGGNFSRAGVVVAERLTATLIESGSLDVIERNQLQAVTEELRLGSAGAFDPVTVKRLGRVLGVDALVTGTALELLSNQIEVHARLIDVETARVLGAGTARMEKDWSDPDAPGAWVVRPPPLPPAFAEDRSASFDGRAGAGNAAAAAFLESSACDSTEGRVIDVRARYWALRLRSPGFSSAALRSNPGSEIKDPGLRERFYSRLRTWVGEPHIPPLDASDLALLARCD
ncbi:MAG: hypothetical protein NTX64_17705 [Elusimicrobia bacterium]|nr:hypothetical protein [Elusimicrobiota bacterium]